MIDFENTNNETKEVRCLTCDKVIKHLSEVGKKWNTSEGDRLQCIECWNSTVDLINE